MQTYRVATTISKDGTLTIKRLPFRPGDRVEVIVRNQEREQGNGNRYSLRGKPIQYAQPFGSVAEDDWDVLQ